MKVLSLFLDHTDRLLDGRIFVVVVVKEKNQEENALVDRVMEADLMIKSVEAVEMIGFDFFDGTCS